MSDIKRVIEQVSRDKGIDPDILIGTLEEALKSAAKKKYGSKIDIEVKYNEDSGEIEVFQFREVVEDVADPDLEISLEAGLQLDPECEIGDWLGSKMDTESFGRIAAQSAKQVIIQKIKDAERDAVYANFINRKGEIINGIVQRIDRGQIIVNLGQTEAAPLAGAGAPGGLPPGRSHPGLYHGCPERHPRLPDHPLQNPSGISDQPFQDGGSRDQRRDRDHHGGGKGARQPGQNRRLLQ
jgi:hypothetical protein